MDREQIFDLFDKFSEEHSKFDRIPVEQRLNPCHDICAMLYLQQKFGFTYEAVSGGDHDIIFLNGDIGQLSVEDVLYLVRCGAMEQDGHLCMFV